mmetsp:Transcript_177741/g.569880  ORF Transcript_177741/g.569880 Transcript_177741/m.569880 type:complete len:248 (-) Transcript_177741:232-975(-)
MSLPVLRYFKFPGRCYAARVAMFNTFGKDGWVDERLLQGQFNKLKIQAAEERKAGKTPALATNNLPQLILPDSSRGDGAGTIVITQSHAIARWAARQGSGARTGSKAKYELYPEDDLTAALLVDEAMSLVDGVIGLAPKDEDKEVRLRKREAYASDSGTLGLGMRLLEDRLVKAAVGTGGGGPFLLGAQLTIADLYLKKPLIDMIIEKQFEGVGPDYVEQKYPLLFQHTKAVAEHPLVVEYLKHYAN